MLMFLFILCGSMAGAMIGILLDILQGQIEE